VACKVKACGGAELSRVQMLRNAIAVRVSAAALDKMKSWPEVAAVSVISSRNRTQSEGTFGPR
jgi:hypothetical protein